MARRASFNLRNRAVLVLSLVAFTGLPAAAQVPVDDDGNLIPTLGTHNSVPASDSDYGVEQSDIETLTFAELQSLVGPIALYPDDLLAIVLPASTYPLQIVQAARFLDALKNDSTLKPDESWDESVVALINYPEVIQLLDDDIDWTWRLGEAVVEQQEDLVAAVESFRDRAYASGNLKSDEHQTIVRDQGVIEIVPIDDDVIYVPYYEPERVVVRQEQPVYRYYDRPYPVYYYPYPSGHHFSTNYFWGVTTAFRIGWANNLLHVHHPSYWGHPYFGHHYYGHNYRRPSISVHNSIYVNNVRRHTANRYRDGDYWQPRRRSGARPGNYSGNYSYTRHYRADSGTAQRTRNELAHNTRIHNTRNVVALSQRRHRATTARIATNRARPQTEREPRHTERQQTTRTHRPTVQRRAPITAPQAERRERMQRHVRNEPSRQREVSSRPRQDRSEPARRSETSSGSHNKREISARKEARAKRRSSDHERHAR